MNNNWGRCIETHWNFRPSCTSGSMGQQLEATTRLWHSHGFARHWRLTGECELASPLIWWSQMSVMSDPVCSFLRLRYLWYLEISWSPKSPKSGNSRWKDGFPIWNYHFIPKGKVLATFATAGPIRIFFEQQWMLYTATRKKNWVSFFSYHGFRLRSLQILTVIFKFNLQICFLHVSELLDWMSWVFLPKMQDHSRQKKIEAPISIQTMIFCCFLPEDFSGPAFRLQFSDGHVGHFPVPRPQRSMWSQELQHQKKRVTWGATEASNIQEETWKKTMESMDHLGICLICLMILEIFQILKRLK